MSAIDRLDESALERISELCRRSIADPPSTDELADSLFADDQLAAILGDPDVGVVAVVECDDGPHIRLLAVDPSVRGKGHGNALLEAAEGWVRSVDQHHLLVGADAPYFLWPGAPVTETSLLCLLERRHYSRVEANFDMEVDLTALPADPGGHRLARAEERDDIDAWMGRHWPNWRLEVLRALDKGNLVVAHDDDDGDDDGDDRNAHTDVSAFCAFEVNRKGFLGPVAVRPDLMGKGRGRGVLVGALHELRRRGNDRVAVVWVGPVVPYGAVGGRVTDVYFVYRKELS